MLYIMVIHSFIHSNVNTVRRGSYPKGGSFSILIPFQKEEVYGLF